MDLRTLILCLGLVSGVSAQFTAAEEARWQKASDRGFAWLEAQQQGNGAWCYHNNRSSPSTAVTALCALAFLSDGRLPTEPERGKPILRALDYLLSMEKNGRFMYFANWEMYEHGFTTLFLAEVSGMTGSRERELALRSVLPRAVRHIENAQRRDGGWSYGSDGGRSDLSLTVVQLVALRASREMGVRVNEAVIQRGLAYVRRSNSRGGFTYRVGERLVRFTTTAAGAACLVVAGDAAIDGPMLKAAHETLIAQGKRRIGHHVGYGYYYASLVAQFHGNAGMVRLWRPMADNVLRQQHANGGWAPGPVRTAFFLLCLNARKSNLPILRRAGAVRAKGR